MLDTACAQLARWREELGPLAPRRVNVNLSALQLGDPRLLDTVTGALVRHGVPASGLCLEITESAIMSDPAASRETLLALREVGVSVAIDDFGVGYSSLAYLQRLPVDHLKIDRSFVLDLATGGDGALAAAVVSLAGALGLSAIAEGVEVPEQAERLQEMGCRLGQGWLWARAMSGDDLARWVRERAGVPAAAGARRRSDVSDVHLVIVGYHGATLTPAPRGRGARGPVGRRARRARARGPAVPAGPGARPAAGRHADRADDPRRGHVRRSGWPRSSAPTPRSPPGSCAWPTARTTACPAGSGR